SSTTLQISIKITGAVVKLLLGGEHSEHFGARPGSDMVEADNIICRGYGIECGRFGLGRQCGGAVNGSALQARWVATQVALESALQCQRSANLSVTCRRHSGWLRFHLRTLHTSVNGIDNRCAHHATVAPDKKMAPQRTGNTPRRSAPTQTA